MVDKRDCAPVALFVYNRPEHTRRTVESLQKNSLSSQTKLYIFSDAPKAQSDIIRVKEVRDYLKTVDGFAAVDLILRKRNLGLAGSIINGVTQVCNKHGRVIVLEDDLVTSSGFLEFMNKALDTYQPEKKVWHISGWSYPINSEGLGSSFLWKTMNCWGWATWDDRWQHFSKDPDRLVSSWSRAQIKKFNLEGAYNFWKQIKLNQKEKLNTWAVFWYATIFENDGLCLNPTKTYVTNIGHDGSGENCRRTDHFSTYEGLDSHNQKLSFPPTIECSELAQSRIIFFLNGLNGKNFFIRLLKKLKRITYWLIHR